MTNPDNIVCNGEKLRDFAQDQKQDKSATPSTFI